MLGGAGRYSGVGVPSTPDVVVDRLCEGLVAVLGRQLTPHRVACEDVEVAVRRRRMELFARASVVVLGPCTRTGVGVETAAWRVRKALPHVGIAACLPFTHEEHLRFGLYLRSGVDAVFAIEPSGAGIHSDVRDLVQMARRRLRAPAPEVELRQVCELVPVSEERTIVLYCLRNGYLRLDVETVAALFGLSARTLSDRLHKARLPSCGELIRLGRQLFLKHQRVAHPEWSQEKVAECGGFESAEAMRAARRRLTRSLDDEGEIGRALAHLLAPAR